MRKRKREEAAAERKKLCTPVCETEAFEKNFEVPRYHPVPANCKDEIRTVSLVPAANAETTSKMESETDEVEEDWLRSPVCEIMEAMELPPAAHQLISATHMAELETTTVPAAIAAPVAELETTHVAAAIAAPVAELATAHVAKKLQHLWQHP